MKCPKCGFEIESQQRRAVLARWKDKTAQERSAFMSKVRRKGIERAKAKSKP